jgi:hypothetical protein
VARTTLNVTRETIVTATVGANTAQVTIRLSPRSEVTITPPTTPPVAGQPTTITVNVPATANVQDVIVNFGDGSGALSLGRLAGQTAISHTYQVAGVYTVSATAVTVTGERETVSTSITVLPQRPLAVTLTAAPRCAVVGTTTVVFTASATGGTPILYRWDLNGDGVIDRDTTGPSTDVVYPAGTATGQLPVSVRVQALDAGEGLAQTTITIASNAAGCTAGG